MKYEVRLGELNWWGILHNEPHPGVLDRVKSNEVNKRIEGRQLNKLRYTFMNTYHNATHVTMDAFNALDRILFSLTPSTSLSNHVAYLALPPGSLERGDAGCATGEESPTDMGRLAYIGGNFIWITVLHIHAYMLCLLSPVSRSRHTISLHHPKHASVWI